MIVDRNALAQDLEKFRGVRDTEIIHPDLAKKRVVFTNGCFDLLHVGHVTYLQEAAKLGMLVVALNEDESVSRLKPGRPVVKLKDRMKVMDSLRCVEWVTSFHEDTPLNLIKELKPDILVKGSDYKVEDIVGHKEIVTWGGEVLTIPILHDYSTTDLLAKAAIANQKQRNDADGILPT